MYKGPIKRIHPIHMFDKTWPIKRHENTYEPKHAGNDNDYQLQVVHKWKPKHEKKDPRYGKDGRMRKVLKNPKIEEKEEVKPLPKLPYGHLPFVCYPKPKLEQAPPMQMMMYLKNDIFMHPFELEKHREKRVAQSRWQRSIIADNSLSIALLSNLSIWLFLMITLLYVQEDIIKRGVFILLIATIFLFIIIICLWIYKRYKWRR